MAARPRGAREGIARVRSRPAERAIAGSRAQGLGQSHVQASSNDRAHRWHPQPRLHHDPRTVALVAGRVTSRVDPARSDSAKSASSYRYGTLTSRKQGSARKGTAGEMVLPDSARVRCHGVPKNVFGIDRLEGVPCDYSPGAWSIRAYWSLVFR